MKKDIKKFDLSEDEYFECLTRAEINSFISGEQAQSENPRSIFVVAQAGAGKTGLKSFVIKEAQEAGIIPGYIEFNPDDIATYHKYYKEILKEFPDESYAILQKFVSPALDTYLRQAAVARKFNLVQEGTFGNTDVYVEIIDFQKNGGKADIGDRIESGYREVIDVPGGYLVDVNVLAVDRFESYLSSLEREQYYRESGLPPRVVTLGNHDYAYNRIIDTLRILEERHLIDNGRVFRRGPIPVEPKLVYNMGDQEYPTLADAVIGERQKNHIELLKNPSDFYDRINSLRARINSNGIPEQQARLDELKKLFTKEALRFGVDSHVESLIKKPHSTVIKIVENTNREKRSDIDF